MNKKKIMALVLSTLVLSSNSNLMVMAQTTNNIEIVNSESSANISTEDSLLADYTNAVSDEDLIFRASNVGTQQLNLSDYIDSAKNLSEGTIVVRFKYTGSTTGTERNLIKFSNSTLDDRNHFRLFFKKENNTQGQMGYRCKIDNVDSPSGQHFSGENFKYNEYNTMVLSIKSGQGYFMQLNTNGFKNYGSQTRARFLSDINQANELNTIIVGDTDIEIDYIEFYGKKISQQNVMGIASANIDVNEGADKIKNISVAKVSSEHTVANKNDSTREADSSFAVDRNLYTFWHTAHNSNTGEPHYITLDLGEEGEFIDTLEYLERTDTAPRAGTGAITKYKVYASDSIPTGPLTIENKSITTDGFTEIAEGEISENKKLHLIDVNDIKTRYVTLLVTEGGSNHATSAELYVNRGIEIEGPEVETPELSETVLSGTEHLTLFASSSEETRDEASGAQGQATKVIDGDKDTYWHSRYSTNNQQRKEHSITLELKQGITEVKSVNYLPRQNSGERPNGTLENYQIYTSIDGVKFDLQVEDTITWNNSTWNEDMVNYKTLNLPTPVYAKYVKLVWPEKANQNTSKGGHASAAEITVTVGEKAKAPSAPTNVNVSGITQTGAKLTWDAPTDATITGYKILNSDGQVAYDNIGADQREYLLTNLEAEKQYSYKIVAIGEYGLESTAAEVSFETKKNNNSDTLTLTDIKFSDNIQAGVKNTIELVTTKTDSTVYKLEVYNTREGWKTIESTFEVDGNGNGSVSWIPTSQGQNLVRVTAKDNSGKVLVVNKWVTVNNENLVINGFDTDGNLQVVNEEVITLNSRVNNDLAESTTYTLEVYNTIKGWTKIGDYNHNTVYNEEKGQVELKGWNPEKIGQNLVSITAKDSSGKVVRYQKWVTVKNDALTLTGFNLEVNGQVPETVVAGNGVTIVPVGGTTESTEYTYEVYDTTNGWRVVTSDQWTPEVANKYLVRVTAKDNSGKTLRVDKWITVK